MPHSDTTDRRLVFLSPSAEIGGAETMLLAIVSAVKQHRPNWSVTIVVPEDGPLAVRLREMGVAVMVLRFPQSLGRTGEAALVSANPFRLFSLFLSLLAYGFRLRKRLRALAPHLLHSNGLKTHVLGALVKPRNASLVWHMHEYIGSRPQSRRVLRLLSSRCDLSLAISQSIAADCASTLGAATRCMVIYNVIDTDRFSPDGGQLDLDSLAGLESCDPTRVRVGLVATYASWKGHDTFLRAAKLCRSDCRFYIIGGPIYRTGGSQIDVSFLRARAAALCLQEIAVTGFVSDAPAAMRTLDIVVHASDRPEPFGLVIAQAMACGRAVIVSFAGGASEVVAPEVDALTFPPGDAAALAAAIDRLAAAPTLRSELGAVARVNAVEKFSLAVRGSQFIDAYETIIRKQ